MTQAQYLEVHLTILEPVLTSLHIVLLAVDDQLGRLQSSPRCYPLFHVTSASLINVHGAQYRKHRVTFTLLYSVSRLIESIYFQLSYGKLKPVKKV